MMWVLDTDHLTILGRGGSTALSLQMRLGLVPIEDVVTTIINYEEQMRGWLSLAAQVGATERMIEAYARLQAHIETFRDITILAFDRAAFEQFQYLRQRRLGVGTSDLKIAAVCLAHDATLLTRNLRDFGKIPGLRAEDWLV